jgi:hypothetical protein
MQWRRRVFFALIALGTGNEFMEYRGEFRQFKVVENRIEVRNLLM